MGEHDESIQSAGFKATPSGFDPSRDWRAWNAAIYEAAQTAYLQCLRTGRKSYRTRNLGLPRSAYNVDYASEVSAAIMALARDSDGSPEGGDGLSGSVHDSAAPKGIAR
jgi:hypothetical protein